MPKTQYHQYCPLAHAAEVIGERWTLLLVRELLLGPKRFTDLLARLRGISSSVLAERLARAEASGVIRRVTLPPPAPVTLYELTELGSELRPAVLALMRWGTQLLPRRRHREQFEPEWLRLGLLAFARSTPSPPLGYGLRLRHGRKEATIRVAGGATGVQIEEALRPGEPVLVGSVEAVLSVLSGTQSLEAALAAGAVESTGELRVLRLLPSLFDFAGAPPVPVFE